MIARRAAALAAYTLLLVTLLRFAPPAELGARAALLGRGFALPHAERRAEGRGTEYDRAFFRFLLEARDLLPLDARGVALYAPDIPEWGGLYLAVYELAPIPVALAPRRLPEGWVALAYGPARPSGLRLVRELSGGAILAP